MSDSGDVVVFLSSELIAEVMEKYFRKELFKKPVTIVDLKGAENGYSFTLAFSVPVIVDTPRMQSGTSVVAVTPDIPPVVSPHETYSRAQNGRFIKTRKKDASLE